MKMTIDMFMKLWNVAEETKNPGEIDLSIVAPCFMKKVEASKSHEIAALLRNLRGNSIYDNCNKTDQNVPDVPVEVHPTDQIRLTDRAVYQLDPRTSGLELRLDPRSDARIDRTEVRLSRPTRQAKTDGQARTNLTRANSDSDHGFSLLA
ncbi:hypothetical protein F2Q70_00044692 [Brassica cretica]|uniref:Uncharacterized protein n=1 Tax=Brassica cretica TaxID=69181 RepID=A0A8S9KHQ8_BRACR|nr:hypothetical protein F2Q70_00044692 [Brassica cretica]